MRDHCWRYPALETLRRERETEEFRASRSNCTVGEIVGKFREVLKLKKQGGRTRSVIPRDIIAIGQSHLPGLLLSRNVHGFQPSALIAWLQSAYRTSLPIWKNQILEFHELKRGRSCERAHDYVG